MSAARQRHLRSIVVPETNAAEAAVVEQLEVIPVSSLAEAAAFFAGHLEIDPVPSRLQELFNTLSHYDEDYADVRGQESAKRALVIAAAGAHDFIMLGPPESGETDGTINLLVWHEYATICQDAPVLAAYIRIGNLRDGDVGRDHPRGRTNNQCPEIEHALAGNVEERLNVLVADVPADDLSHIVDAVGITSTVTQAAKIHHAARGREAVGSCLSLGGRLADHDA
jgi:hypothetical protein